MCGGWKKLMVSVSGRVKTRPGQDPAARQTLPDNNLPSGIDPMDLKN
jgi:hypothetical protein